MPKLTEEAVRAAMETLQGWRLEQGKLIHDYAFPDFAAAMIFVNQVAKSGRVSQPPSRH